MTDSRTTRKPRFDVVSRDVAGSSAAIFAVLADPRRHPALDDSGMVLEPVDTGTHSGPITALGQVFRMRMTMGGVNRYETDNHVNVFEPDRAIGWAVAEAAGEPLGWTWRFDLEPVDPGGEVTRLTRVTQTYDWSQVTDAETLRTIPFPAVPRDARLETLTLLAELVETP
ncbi:MAG: polyketide cyclase [Humibacillus sp.]|nr:polyketide cyclase [Humibacillus sp.]